MARLKYSKILEEKDINVIKMMTFIILLAACTGLWIYTKKLQEKISKMDHIIDFYRNSTTLYVDGRNITIKIKGEHTLDDDDDVINDNFEDHKKLHQVFRRNTQQCVTRATLQDYMSNKLHSTAHFIADVTTAVMTRGYWGNPGALKWKEEAATEIRVPNTLFQLRLGGKQLRVKENGMYYLYLQITYTGKHITHTTSAIPQHCSFVVEKVNTQSTSTNTAASTQAILWTFTTQYLGGWPIALSQGDSSPMYAIDGIFDGVLHRLQAGDVLQVKPDVLTQSCKVNWHKDKVYFGGYKVRP